MDYLLTRGDSHTTVPSRKERECRDAHSLCFPAFSNFFRTDHGMRLKGGGGGRGYKNMLRTHQMDDVCGMWREAL